jgi:Tol biopolymer transport system component
MLIVVIPEIIYINIIIQTVPMSENDKKHSKEIIPLGMRNIRFLTNDLNFVDGRPVYSPDGRFIIFMRQNNDGNPDSISSLYMILTDGSMSSAELVFDGINPKTGKRFNVTRPDFSWTRKKFQITFDAVGDGIWLLDLKTKKVKQVLEPVIDRQSYVWSYPAWYHDGHSVIVTNYNDFSDTSTAYHQLVKANVDQLNQFEVLTNNQLVWPGMSSVSQKSSRYITFAGQLPVTPQPPTNPTCINGGKIDPDGYAQNCNQIWIQKGDNQPFQIDFDQGRAPWFSPNGKFIVFESNRDNPDLVDDYRIFLYSLSSLKKSLTERGSKGGLCPPVQTLTPASLNVQHAKWSPNGKQITFAVSLFGKAQGIAVMDLE